MVAAERVELSPEAYETSALSLSYAAKTHGIGRRMRR